MSRKALSRFKHFVLGSILIPATLLTLAPHCLFARQIVRVPGPITVDGRLDDQEWSTIQPLILVQLEPVPGANPTETSEVFLAHDGEALYAAARFFDSEPDQIRANGLQRDEMTGDDLFGLVLDSLNDDESALAFYTTPAGTRIDTAISNDGEWGGTNPFNRNWNTFWDSAARTTDTGWEAEVRIPFSSLRFREVNGRVVMGVLTWRQISRKSETAVFPAVDAKWHRAHLKPSLGEDMELVGVKTKRQLLVTPYALGGWSRQTEVPDTSGKLTAAYHSLGYQVIENRSSQAGADVKWGISSDLTLDMTVNTDFAQVEADDAQVNLSRFSIFQPEKRLFFQERAGLFDFGTGDFSRLFYSRQIGIDDDGAPVPILGGVRLVGRIGAWDVGFLDMQTESTDSMSSENMGVARVRRQAFNNGSYVGGMVTSRLARDGSSNIAYGLDTVVRFDRGDELTVRWAQTFDQELNGQSVGSIDSGRLFARMQRRNRNGWGYTAVTGWCGPDYNPELGFTSREGFTQLYGELRHGRIADENSWYRNRNRWIDGGAYLRDEDGELDSGHFGIGTNVQTRAGAWMFADLRTYGENLVESFEMTDSIEVPEGEHSWIGLTAGFNLPRGRNLHLWGNTYIGEFYDGKRLRVTLGPEWTASRHLTVGLRYELNAIRFPVREQKVDIHLARLKIRWSFNSRLSADLYSQLSSLDEMVSSNLRFRYNFREGTDIYLVFNESTLTNRLQDGLTLPRTDGRSVIVKYQHTLNL